MRVIRRKELTKKIGLERSAIYYRVAAGTFPKPIKLGPKSVAWVEADVDQWLADRVAERDREVER